jgi:hypothetical protein
MSAQKKAPPKEPASLLIPEKIAPLVHVLRYEKVLLDSDLAELYGVGTKVLNQAVQRNLGRFPNDFMFQLTQNEFEEFDSLGSQFVTLNAQPPNLRSQIVTSSLVDQEMKPKIAASRSHGGRRTLPYVFTEQGVAMLSSVLRSPRAVEVNIAIMRTFVQLRRLMDSNALLAEKIHSLEAKYSGHDDQFQVVFDAIRSLITTADAPKREIGFRTD